MRILHIDTGRDMRGGQWQALHLLQSLADRNIPCRLLSPPGSGLFQAAASLSLDVRPLRPLRVSFDARPFQLVHAHDAHAHTLALFCGKPLVVSRRVAFTIRRTPWSHWKYKRANLFLAVSRFVERRLIEAGIPDRRISVVYDGVRLPEPAPAENRALVLALDSGDPGKGKTILQQASRLAGIPVHFSKQLAHDLPRAALFLYVTNLEGLGSAVLLAMAYGAPVIASKVGGLPEIVEDGHTGILTDNAPQAIATAMLHLHRDPALAARLAACARKRVERQFTVEHMVEQTMRAYREVLA